MALNRGRNRAADFDDLIDSTPQEIDVEAEEFLDDESSDEVENATEARGHYVDVSESKLRGRKDVALGAQYRGSRVGRDALSADEDGDDPFGRGFEDEDSEEEDGEEDIDEGMDDDGDSSGEDVDEHPSVKLHNGESAAANREQLLRAVAKDQKTVASSLAQSTRLDAEKGRAVKKQRIAFDALLNARIRMQKTLIATNTLVGTPTDQIKEQSQESKEAIEAAETAAFNLWSSLNAFREDLIAARAGEKRKRRHFTAYTATEELWSHMRSQESSTQPHRDATLQRWSVKARGVTAVPQQGLLSKADTQVKLVDSLKGHLSEPDRLLKRAHTPRSCAPLQLARNITMDEKIYDDADFYGVLLKELLEQKDHDSIAASNIDLNFNVRREAKAKKTVDTKASKGRKMRFTVHEKAQNTMAPDLTGFSWGERQQDEFFGSLFGQRLALGEERDEDGGTDDEGLDAEEAGLMLFRS